MPSSSMRSLLWGQKRSRCYRSEIILRQTLLTYRDSSPLPLQWLRYLLNSSRKASQFRQPRLKSPKWQQDSGLESEEAMRPQIYYERVWLSWVEVRAQPRWKQAQNDALPELIVFQNSRTACYLFLRRRRQCYAALQWALGAGCEHSWEMYPSASVSSASPYCCRLAWVMQMTASRYMLSSCFFYFSKTSRKYFSASSSFSSWKLILAQKKSKRKDSFSLWGRFIALSMAYSNFPCFMNAQMSSQQAGENSELRFVALQSDFTASSYLHSRYSSTPRLKQARYCSGLSWMALRQYSLASLILFSSKAILPSRKQAPSFLALTSRHSWQYFLHQAQSLYLQWTLAMRQKSWSLLGRVEVRLWVASMSTTFSPLQQSMSSMASIIPNSYISSLGAVSIRNHISPSLPGFFLCHFISSFQIFRLFQLYLRPFSKNSISFLVGNSQAVLPRQKQSSSALLKLETFLKRESSPFYRSLLSASSLFFSFWWIFCSQARKSQEAEWWLLSLSSIMPRAKGFSMLSGQDQSTSLYYCSFWWLSYPTRASSKKMLGSLDFREIALRMILNFSCKETWFFDCICLIRYSQTGRASGSAFKAMAFSMVLLKFLRSSFCYSSMLAFKTKASSVYCSFNAYLNKTNASPPFFSSSNFFPLAISSPQLSFLGYRASQTAQMNSSSLAKRHFSGDSSCDFYLRNKRQSSSSFLSSWRRKMSISLIQRFSIGTYLAASEGLPSLKALKLQKNKRAQSEESPAHIGNT